MLPDISPNIEIFTENGEKYSVFNQKTGKTYLIGKLEYYVLRHLDGTKTLEDLKSMVGNLTEQQIRLLIEQFEKIGFIRGEEPKRKFNLIKMRKGLFNGNRLINPQKYIWKFLNFSIIYLSVPIFLLGLFYALLNYEMASLFTTGNIFTPDALLLIPFILIVLSLHEMGHAVVARCNGVNVPEIGIMLYWFMPCAYTNLSSITFQKKRIKRIVILLAGILVNLQLAGICLLLLSVLPSSVHIYLGWAAIANISLILMNTLWVIKLDGYFILEQLLEMKRLREKSFSFLKESILKISVMFKTRKTTKYDGNYVGMGHKLDHIVYMLYAVLACVYIPVLIGSLVIRLINIL